jgi:hypothetical protein
MSSSDQDKQRNREIAANEAKREIVSNVRVSSWAIVTTIVVGVIVFGIVWAWFHR